MIVWSCWLDVVTIEGVTMNSGVCTLRELAYIVPLSTEEFARAVGISRRQLDRYLSVKCKKVPLKVLNSAKWVHHIYG
ncbi:hypothetical protein VPHD472_0010 [Vibrio phage D472]